MHASSSTVIQVSSKLHTSKTLVRGNVYALKRFFPPSSEWVAANQSSQAGVQFKSNLHLCAKMQLPKRGSQTCFEEWNSNYRGEQIVVASEN